MQIRKCHEKSAEKEVAIMCFVVRLLWLLLLLATPTKNAHTHTRIICECNKIARQQHELRPHFAQKNLLRQHFAFVCMCVMLSLPPFLQPFPRCHPCLFQCPFCIAKRKIC